MNFSDVFTSRLKVKLENLKTACGLKMIIYSTFGIACRCYIISIEC